MKREKERERERREREWGNEPRGVTKMANGVTKHVLIYIFLSAALWAPTSDAMCSGYFLCYISNTFSYLNKLDPEFNDTAAFLAITNRTWNSYDEACDEVLRITNIVNHEPGK